jgi:hypothetical protein
MPKRRDSASTIDANGVESNARLHEEMCEGVDDYDFRMKTREALLKKGVPLHVLDAVLPVKK